MKEYFILPLALLFTAFFCTAQSSTKTIPYKGKEYGKDATEKITMSQDESLRKVYTIEIKDKDEIVKEKSIYKKNLVNEWEVIKFTNKGRKKTGFDNTDTLKFDHEGKLTSFVSTYEWGQVVYSRGPGGELRLTRCDEKSPYKFHNFIFSNRVQYEEETFDKKFQRLEKLEEDGISAPENSSHASFLITPVSCQSKLNVFVGPSVVWGKAGPDNEIFFGGHAYGLYNINPHIGVGIDYSKYCKKNDNQKFSRSFALGRLQYTFGNFGDNGEEYCDNGVLPEAHIVIGWGFESIKYTFNGNTTKNSGSGFAAGAGGGIGVKLKKNINLSFSADYVGIKFKNTDDINSNIRLSAGVNFNLLALRENH